MYVYVLSVTHAFNVFSIKKLMTFNKCLEVIWSAM
jgi:hypothetical protein